MKRRVWNIVAVASLLVSIAAAGLWLHSQLGSIHVHWSDGNVYHSVISDSGSLLSATHWGGEATPSFGPRVETGHVRQWGGAHLNGELYGRFGFGTLEGVQPPWTYRQKWVPYWAVVVVSAVIPGAWVTQVAVPRLWRLWIERERRRAGLCGRCGYDLRASKERCPECGTMVMGEVAA